MPNPAVCLSLGLHAIRNGPNFVRHNPAFGIASNELNPLSPVWQV